MGKNRFESIGIYLPEKIVSTRELTMKLQNMPAFNLEYITGIKNRRVRSDSEDSFIIGLNAAKDCLKRSRYDISEIDIIISTSISRAFGDGYVKHLFEPALSHYYKRELGADSAINFDITNACSGMLTAVYVLNNLIHSGVVKNGMIISGECITPVADTALIEISRPIDDQFASLTVGDAGAVVIMDKSPDDNEGIDFIDFVTVSDYADLCLGLPSNENMAFAMHTKSVDIHRESIKLLPVFLDEYLKKYGKSFSDVDYVIPHQTSTKAIKAGIAEVEKYFGKKFPEVLQCIEEYGNTASTSHFLVLDNQIKAGKIKGGTRILFLAQASGIQLGFMLATMGLLGDSK